jgi:hypothetical protein
VILTTQREVEDRLGRPLTGDEAARFPVLARDASAFLYAEAPRIPTALPLPDAVVAAASWLVIGALSSPPGAAQGIQSESLGGYQVVYSSSSDGGGGAFSLTSGMRAALRPWSRARVGTMQIDPATAVVVGPAPVSGLTNIAARP